MSLPHLARLALLSLVLLGFRPAQGVAQVSHPADWRATRGELEGRAQMLERATLSTAYGERIRGHAREQLTAIRLRLVDGDFRLGDQIVVAVQGQAVQLLDTLVVQDSLIINIPNIRRVRLHGVLRSELDELVTREVAFVVRDAVVDAHSLVRVAVTGQVARPGFLAVPSETMVDQLLTAAGGPTPTADLARIRLVRGDTVLHDAGAIQRAIARGETLVALGIRDGDLLELPQRGEPWNRAETMQIVMMFLGPLVTLVLLRGQQ